MTSYFLNLLLAGLLGVLFQIFTKIITLKNKAKIANHKFSLKEYLEDDWATILASLVGVFILIVCMDEVLKLKPALEDYIKWIFVFVGYTGSSIIQSILSVTGRKLNAIIDVKTNLADGVVPPVNADNKEGAIEIQKEDNR